MLAHRFKVVAFDRAGQGVLRALLRDGGAIAGEQGAGCLQGLLGREPAALQDAQPLGGKAAHQIAQEHRRGVVAHLCVGRDGAVRIARRIKQRARRVDRGLVAFKREERAGKAIGRIGAGRDVGHGA